MTVDPIKVCFPFVGDEVGGSHISALKLVYNLDRRKIQPLIVLNQPDGVLANYIRQEGLNFVTLPGIELIAPESRRDNRKINFWKYAFKTLPALVAFLKANQIQIVHTNDGQIHSTWSLAARLSGAKHLWHHRADPRARGVNYLAPLFAHHIVTVSRFSRPLRPIIPVASRLSVVNNPFDRPPNMPDRQEAKNKLLNELQLPRGTHLLAFVGSFIERKRPLLFVEAIKRFTAQYPEIPIAGLLFGENVPGGPALDIDVRNRAVQLSIEDKIFFLGFRQPIEPLMAGVDIMLVPAVNEPFGRTLIECMVTGTPVIATDHGGNREAIQHGVNGFLVQPENAEAFVEPIHTLLTREDVVNRIKMAGMSYSTREFSIATHVERLTEIYRSLI